VCGSDRKLQEATEVPKMKTNRGAAKRLRRTGTGKIKRMRANKSHILTKKSKKRKRRLRSATLVSAGDLKRMKRLLPGS
jgi:large subunit ribosomal protein L35